MQVLIPNALQPADVEEVIRSVVTGTPFVEIVRYAREQNMDLIVMGTLSRPGEVGDLLVGSQPSEEALRQLAAKGYGLALDLQKPFPYPAPGPGRTGSHRRASQSTSNRGSR